MIAKPFAWCLKVENLSLRNVQIRTERNLRGYRQSEEILIETMRKSGFKMRAAGTNIRPPLDRWYSFCAPMITGGTNMLCNTTTLRGYTLRATDGEIGSVRDFYSTMKNGLSGTSWQIPAAGFQAAKFSFLLFLWVKWTAMLPASTLNLPDNK